MNDTDRPMDDAERQRTMDFILRQQAQYAANMQRNEEQTANLRRVVVMMARQFRKERLDIRERITALVDAQIQSEEKLSRSGEWQAQMEKNFARADARMTRLETDAERTRKDLDALKYAVESHDDDINALFLINKSNGEAIARLTDVVASLGGRRNGGEGSA
jgi:hypothetical protein